MSLDDLPWLGSLTLTVVDDNVIDSENSLVINQAENRIYSALIILKKLIENER